MLTKREKAADARAEYLMRAGLVIKGFVAKGFGTLSAVTAIAQNQFPDLKNEDVYNFWNVARRDDAILLKMEIVLEKLKGE